MSMKLCRDAYLKLVEEDIAWLEAHTVGSEHSLERRHIIGILRDSVNFYYRPRIPARVPTEYDVDAS